MMFGIEHDAIPYRFGILSLTPSVGITMPDQSLGNGGSGVADWNAASIDSFFSPRAISTKPCKDLRVVFLSSIQTLSSFVQ